MKKNSSRDKQISAEKEIRYRKDLFLPSLCLLEIDLAHPFHMSAIFRPPQHLPRTMMGEENHLPPQGIVAVVPFLNMTEENGPTEFMMGSHVNLVRGHLFLSLLLLFFNVKFPSPPPVSSQLFLLIMYFLLGPRLLVQARRDGHVFATQG